jgi:hypothetical protein
MASGKGCRIDGGIVVNVNREAIWQAGAVVLEAIDDFLHRPGFLGHARCTVVKVSKPPGNSMLDAERQAGGNEIDGESQQEIDTDHQDQHTREEDGKLPQGRYRCDIDIGFREPCPEFHVRFSSVTAVP